MAPMTRSSRTTVPQNSNFLRAQPSREESWELAGSDGRSDSSRAQSEDHNASLEEYDNGYDSHYERGLVPHGLEDNDEDYEDILHPLREAANRVGREVERFAEALDGYNPLRASDEADKQEMTFELIETYHEIAIDAVKRLREEHKSELRRQNGTEWRKKMRGFKINQDPDMMDEDEHEGADDIESLDLESRTTLQDLERWEQEARTWDLLRRMTTIQYSAAPSIELPPIHRYSSEREIWDSFLKMDGLGLERNTVLTWLKETANEAEEDIDVLVQDLQQNAERGDIIAHGWLHTKSAIKHQKRTHAWPYVLDSSSPAVKKVLLNSSKTEPLVTQLDPDAPTRQGLKLEAQDEYFERAIWRGCYELLRRGKSMDEVREWCGDRTEIWRAVSMSGLPDNSQESNESGDLNYASKALWRRMCYALAKRDGGDPYERAVYGILSGDFWSVDPVCRSWNDNLFAHYNALVRSQYEAFVQTHYPHRASADVVKAHPVFDAVQFHGEPSTANSRIVDLLNLKPSLEAESKEPLKVVQSVLIAKTFRDFICQQGLALSKWANQDIRSNIITKLGIDPDNEDKVAYIRGDDYETLRVLAHILIAFKSFGMDLGDEVDTYAIENIIVAYISFLKLAGKEDLIPLYAAQLSEDRCYATLSRELLDVTTHEGRHTQIKLMRDLGLDVQRFVKSQTYFLMQDYPDKSEGYPALGNFHILEGDSSRQHLCRKIKPDYLGNTVITPQKLMVRSLEWYLYVEGMWSETFQTGAMLYKRFYKHMNLAAARELAVKCSASSICLAKTPAILRQELDFAGLDADLEEGNLNDTMEMALLKRHMAAEARSYRDLEGLLEALDYIEGTAGIIDALDEPIQDRNIKDLRREFHKNFGTIKNGLTKVLNPDWLVKCQKEDPEFKLLREAYLPEVILAYDSIFHFAGLFISRDNFLECMDLATIIAAEGSDLPDLFLKTGRMGELVAALAGDSTSLLYSTGPDKSHNKPSKRIREKGWTRDLWRIQI